MGLADTLADKLLLSDIDLARFEATEQRRVLALLNTLRRDIVAQLTANDPTAVKRSAFQRRRLEAILPEITATIRQAYSSLNRTQQTTLREVAAMTGAGVRATVNATFETQPFTAGLSEARLKALVSDVAMEGAPLQEWWSTQAGALRRRWHNSMRQGLALQEPLSRLRVRTRDVLKNSASEAETLVRTGLISTQNTARNAIYDVNADALRGVQWITALDTRVCVICRALSGKLFSVPAHRPIGHSLPWPGVIAHPRCRCTQIPIPEGIDVAEDVTFDVWLQGRTVAQQRAILGRGRFALWSEGKIRLDQMVSQDHRPLTLVQLQEKAA